MDIVRVSPEIWNRTHVMTIVKREPEELEFQEVREQRLIKQTVKEEFVFGDDHEWRKRSDEEILPKLGGEMKEQMKLRKCVVLLEKLTKMDKHTQKYPNHHHTKKGSYKCDECGKCFSLRSNLNRHYGIHVLEIPYTCEKCGKKFRRKGSLHSHLRIHAAIRPFKCNKCGKAFADKPHDLVHLRCHTAERSFECQCSGQTIKRKSNLQHQLAQWPQRPQNKSHFCKTCGKAFGAKCHLNTHLRVPSNERPFQCKKYGMTFKHNSHLLCHDKHPHQCKERRGILKDVTTIVKCEPEEQEFQEVREQRLIKQTLKEDFVFGDGHEWRKRSDEEILPKLGAEMKEQMKLRKCVVLLEKFTQMDKHTQKYPYHLHTKKGSYKCNECGKYFGLRSNLNRHYGIHVLEIPYTCDKCGKKFRRKERLHSHLRIHAGIRPFKCKECGKAFADKPHYSVHLRCHTDERPFECQCCGKTFKRKSNLQQHQMAQRPQNKSHFCKTCGKAFGAKCQLVRHLRVHSNERPFQCKKCGMTFKHNSHLQRHDKHPHQCRERRGILNGN